MFVLSKKDIEQVFTMEDAIAADERAFCYLSEKKSIVPLRTHIDIPKFQGQSLFMPAYVEPINAVGIKIVSVFPKNVEKGMGSVLAKIILMDGETGDVTCMLDGTYITQMRTGAAAGAATKKLAVKNAKIATLFGTGGQAPAQLEAILSVRKLTEVRVFDLNFERCSAFVEEMNRKLGHYGAKIIVAINAAQAVDNADIVTTVTTSTTPVFDGRRLKKGCHVNGVGSYTPQMQEIDEYTLVNCDKLYVDSEDGALAEAGDLLIPIAKGTLRASEITGDLGDLLLGKIAARESDEEITVFKTVGTAVLDVVTAHEIYQKALRQGIGTEVHLS